MRSVRDNDTKQLPLNFDVTIRKARHNPRSVEAGERGQARRPSQRQTVYEQVIKRGLEGATTNEIATTLGWSDNKVSARMSDLKVMQMIISMAEAKRSYYLTAQNQRFTTSGDSADVFVAKELLTNELSNPATK